MSNETFACQTITFGENQKQEFPAVFAAVAEAGYTGVEIGFRHLQDLLPEQVQDLLDRAGLRLAASHVGGNLEDAAQADGERAILETVLDYLAPIGTRLLMYSGLRYESAAQFDRDLAMLNRSAERCRARGVHLLYHNHNWEFADGARVMDGLLERGSEALGLCPDLGWVHQGGADVVSFLDRAKSRIGAVHFKDFATRDPGLDTVILGTGCAPLRAAAAWLQANTDGLWMIAEQDKYDGPPAAAAAANAHFLTETFEAGGARTS